MTFVHDQHVAVPRLVVAVAAMSMDHGKSSDGSSSSGSSSRSSSSREMSPFLIMVFILLIFIGWYLLRVFFKIMKRWWQGGESGDENSAIALSDIDPHVNGVCYAVSYWSEKGGRPYQEDRHVEMKGVGAKDSSLYGVFDGHGGARAAQYCKEKLLSTVLRDADFNANPNVALRRAFFRTDAEFSATARVRMWTDGTTAVVAAVHNRRVYVANAGDSRGIIVQKGGKARFMSVDHKPNREDEERRINRLGGKVIHWGRWRVQGVLAVSRAIGDVALQPYVTCEPEIMEKDLAPEDEYLVLASDGIWDVLRNDEVARFINSATQLNFISAAKELCSEALMLGSTDNVTALVIDLRKCRISQSEGDGEGGEEGDVGAKGEGRVASSGSSSSKGSSSSSSSSSRSGSSSDDNGGGRG